MDYLSIAKEAEARLHRETALTQADAYRAVLLRLFALTALGETADPAECPQLLQEHDRLVDDLGPRAAAAEYERTKEAYAAQTGRCPLCGGPAHD